MTINKLYRSILYAVLLLLPLLTKAPAVIAQNSDTMRIANMVPGVDVLPYIPKTVISSISITGNKKTKDIIILREITFAEGDTIATE